MNLFTAFCMTLLISFAAVAQEKVPKRYEGNNHFTKMAACKSWEAGHKELGKRLKTVYQEEFQKFPMFDSVLGLEAKCETSRVTVDQKEETIVKGIWAVTFKSPENTKHSLFIFDNMLAAMSTQADRCAGGNDENVKSGGVSQ